MKARGHQKAVGEVGEAADPRAQPQWPLVDSTVREEMNWPPPRPLLQRS